MVKRIVWGGLVALSATLPVPSQAQETGGGLAIDHKAVGCIVAGKFPRMNACFSPSPNVARARIYFRAEGGTSWYYVEMKSDAPCMSGILPKARKELVDKHVDYYVQVTDKAFTESRTEEYDPIVVASEDQCKEKVMATPLPNAAVQVFPSIPAGFATGAGISTAAAVGGGVAAAGAAGGIYAATKNHNNTATTTPSPTTTTPTAGGTTTTTLASTTTTTTTAAPVFRFNLKVSPTQGTDPLDVTVDMCASTPVSSLRYFYDFDGDGVFDFQGPFCSQTRTFHVNGVEVFPMGLPTTTTMAKSHNWTVTACAEPRDEAVVPQTRICQSITVEVSPPPATTTTTSTFGSGAPTNFPSTFSWSSQLDVEGAAGQVVVNGASAVFSASGRSEASVPGRTGQNRVEAQLVQASGKPGTWRFDLSRAPRLVAGSLRIVAGEVAVVTPDTVAFKMKGMAGERIVFTFETAR